MQTEQSTEDLLTMDVYYERASTGKRLANYVIDLVMFYIFVFAFGMLLGLLAPESLDSFTDDNGGFGLLERIITLALYGLFMSLVETLFKGKSVGKFITKTRAVNLDGSEITVSSAFARGFSRAVPFCAFSAFGTPCNPWQDRWTDTMVINDQN
ncbi:MAG: RDD family protein [Ginsengibacter sp.]